MSTTKAREILDLCLSRQIVLSEKAIEKRKNSIIDVISHKGYGRTNIDRDFIDVFVTGRITREEQDKYLDQLMNAE